MKFNEINSGLLWEKSPYVVDADHYCAWVNLSALRLYISGQTL